MPRKLKYDPKRDYYDIIGVVPNDDADAIQRAYRKRAKEYHPDLNQERIEWAKERFQALNEAYSILSDPSTRREYDQLRWPYQSYAPRGATKTDAEKRSTFNYADYVSSAEKYRTAQTQAEQEKDPFQPRPYSYTSSLSRRKSTSTWKWKPVEKRGEWLQVYRLGWIRPVYSPIANLLGSPYRYILLAIAVVLLINTVVILIAAQSDFSEDDASSENPNVGGSLRPLDNPSLTSPTVVSTLSMAGIVTATPRPLERCTNDFKFEDLQEWDTLTTELFPIRVVLQYPSSTYYRFEIFFLGISQNSINEQELVHTDENLPPLSTTIPLELGVLNKRGAGYYQIMLTALSSGQALATCSLKVVYN